MSVTVETRRDPVVPVLFICGALLVWLGLAAASIVPIVMTFQIAFGPLATLPEAAYSGFVAPSAGPSALEAMLTGVWPGLVIAAIGAVVMVVGGVTVITGNRRTPRA